MQENCRTILDYSGEESLISQSNLKDILLNGSVKKYILSFNLTSILKILINKDRNFNISDSAANIENVKNKLLKIVDNLIKKLIQDSNNLRVKYILLVFDGIAPFLKNRQQRLEILNNPRLGCLIPGTEFMIKLDEAFEKIRDENNIFTFFEKINISYSFSYEENEGRRKITGFSENVKTDNIIFDFDFELIMFSLSMYEYFQNINIYLMILNYENIENNNAQFYNITVLREKLKKDKVSIDFFVILCQFLGNDFLPPAKLFQTKKNHFKTLIDKTQYFLKNLYIINFKNENPFNDRNYFKIIKEIFEKSSNNNFKKEFNKDFFFKNNLSYLIPDNPEKEFILENKFFHLIFSIKYDFLHRRSTNQLDLSTLIKSDTSIIIT